VEKIHVCRVSLPCFLSPRNLDGLPGLFLDVCTGACCGSAAAAAAGQTDWLPPELSALLFAVHALLSFWQTLRLH